MSEHAARAQRAGGGSSNSGSQRGGYRSAASREGGHHSDEVIGHVVEDRLSAVRAAQVTSAVTVQSVMHEAGGGPAPDVHAHKG